MILNNQRKVAFTTIACLLSQGYTFTNILHVEPHSLVAIAPIFPYVAYIYAMGKRTLRYDQPLLWIAAIVALTAINMAPYVLSLVL